MRQITFNVYEVGFQHMQEREDGLFELVRVPVTTIEETSVTKSIVRAAIKGAGVECPRGADVYNEKKGRVRYFFETEDLKAICKGREELSL